MTNREFWMHCKRSASMWRLEKLQDDASYDDQLLAFGIFLHSWVELHCVFSRLTLQMLWTRAIPRLFFFSKWK